MGSGFEQSAALQSAAQDGLTDRLALVLTAHLAIELQHLESLSEQAYLRLEKIKMRAIGTA